MIVDFQTGSEDANDTGEVHYILYVLVGPFFYPQTNAVMLNSDSYGAMARNKLR